MPVWAEPGSCFSFPPQISTLTEWLLLSLCSQDQLQQKIICPGPVTCLTASPNGLYILAGVAESIYLWEVRNAHSLARGWRRAPGHQNVQARADQTAQALPFRAPGGWAGSKGMPALWSWGVLVAAGGVVMIVQNASETALC